MTKVSWTCTECGMWHSSPNDSHLRPEFCTYDGKEYAVRALEAMASCIQERLPAEMIVSIESCPLDYRPDWFSAEQKAAKDLRRLMLSAKQGQPFPLLCAMCGHDSSDELPVAEQGVAGVITIERRASA